MLKSASQMPERRTIDISMVYAGGTISSVVKNGVRVGGHSQQLLKLAKQVMPDELDRFRIVGTPEFPYSGLSENITHDTQRQIKVSTARAMSRAPEGVVITHGTDSMEQTAQYLERRLGLTMREEGTPIILTGANHDVAHPQTDAWANLLFALKSVASDPVPMVYIAFQGMLIPADHAVKEPFNGVAMKYADVKTSNYRLKREAQKERDTYLINRLLEGENPNATRPRVVLYDVNVVRKDHADFLKHLDFRTKIVLLRLYHSGTANTDSPSASVAQLVTKLRTERGIVFFGATENGEPTNLRSYETSVKLREAGVVPLYNMTHAVADAKLRLAVRESPQQLITRMLTNQVGEIDPEQVVREDIHELMALYR